MTTSLKLTCKSGLFKQFWQEQINVHCFPAIAHVQGPAVHPFTLQLQWITTCNKICVMNLLKIIKNSNIPSRKIKQNLSVNAL